METGKVRVIFDEIDRKTLADIVSGKREYDIGDCDFALVYFGIKDDGDYKKEAEPEEESEAETACGTDDDAYDDFDAIYDEGFDDGYDAGYKDGYLKASREFRKEKKQEAENGKNA